MHCRAPFRTTPLSLLSTAEVLESSCQYLLQLDAHIQQLVVDGERIRCQLLEVFMAATTRIHGTAEAISMLHFLSQLVSENGNSWLELRGIVQADRLRAAAKNAIRAPAPYLELGAECADADQQVLVEEGERHCDDDDHQHDDHREHKVRRGRRGSASASVLQRSVSHPGAQRRADGAVLRSDARCLVRVRLALAGGGVEGREEQRVDEQRHQENEAERGPPQHARLLQRGSAEDPSERM
mmetsp:Transcript_34940/g.77574  ORF Transcript_34940/g.77574 Transcript_34940/m.77574 type:complete len:240 (+) Transcript_34940:1100-1819(+)